MTEPSWTMGDIEILSGRYRGSTLGIDRSAPWFIGNMPMHRELSADERAWFGTFLNGVTGSKPRREVTVTIGDGVQAKGMPRESVAMDSWRRDSRLKERPELNASPMLNRNPVEEALDVDGWVTLSEIPTGTFLSNVICRDGLFKVVP